MSASSATKKSEILAQDELTQLDEAMNQSTDMCDDTQLLLPVRLLTQTRNHCVKTW